MTAQTWRVLRKIGEVLMAAASIILGAEKLLGQTLNSESEKKDK